ncbi:unnamed protein product, partial [marine sediment metagenome]
TQLKETIIHVYWRCLTGFFVGYVFGYSYMFNLMGEFNLTFPIVWGAINGLGIGAILFCISFSAIVITNMLNSQTRPL